MTNGLKKEDSAALKGLAVLLLIFHHCYRLADRIERYQVDLCGLTTEQLVAIAECCKICVAIFAFVSGYGLMYGYSAKMKNKEKDEIMERFKNGDIDILISTTVIEVGVNVPNASLMVVENAERFGLAQLHQLRGRVGRGEYQSYCILKYQGNSDVIRKRMKVMTDTNDGFIISEKDLELRGSGEFFGTRQHGLPEFKIANLFEDMPVLKQVQALAIKITEEDPKLELEKNKELRLLIEEKFKNRVEI